MEVPPDDLDVDQDGNLTEPTPDLDLERRIRRDDPPDPVSNVDLGAYEARTVPRDCPADTNEDGFINVTDLLTVIGGWGNCPPGGPCPGDVGPGPAGNCIDLVVNVTDLLIIIGSWGACEPNTGAGDDELPAWYHGCALMCEGLPDPQACLDGCLATQCAAHDIPEEVCDCLNQCGFDNPECVAECVLGIEIVDPG